MHVYGIVRIVELVELASVYQKIGGTAQPHAGDLTLVCLIGTGLYIGGCCRKRCKLADILTSRSLVVKIYVGVMGIAD